MCNSAEAQAELKPGSEHVFTGKNMLMICLAKVRIYPVLLQSVQRSNSWLNDCVNDLVRTSNVLGAQIENLDSRVLSIYSECQNVFIIIEVGLV